MKKLFIVLLLFSITFIYANELTITEKIEKYSGENADELTQLLETQEGDTLRYLNFCWKIAATTIYQSSLKII